MELSTCKECEATSFSFNYEDGCNKQARLCNTRDCTPCPAGATCSKGSEAKIKHFRPKAVQIGDRVHPFAILKMNSQETLKFFCDKQAPECVVFDGSVSAHAAALAEATSEEYVWEYVGVCTAESAPCNAQDAPSVLLRNCPTGSVLINTTQSGRFDPALQECTPCGYGNYIIDPLRGPCVKCPEGATCPDGMELCSLSLEIC